MMAASVPRVCALAIERRRGHNLELHEDCAQLEGFEVNAVKREKWAGFRGCLAIGCLLKYFLVLVDVDLKFYNSVHCIALECNSMQLSPSLPLEQISLPLECDWLGHQ